MNPDIAQLLLVAIGETIEMTRPIGDGGWAIVTKSLIVHVDNFRYSGAGSVEGRVVEGVTPLADGSSWLVRLDDENVLTLIGVRSAKRGTPIEGTPVKPS